MIKQHLTSKYPKPDEALVQIEHSDGQHKLPAFITKASLSEYFDVRPTDTLEDVIARAGENHQRQLIKEKGSK